VATQHDYPAIDAAATAPGAPASVTVAISEVIADAREGLLAMAVGAGLQVMAAMMSEDVTVACGLKGTHDATGCDPSWQRGRQRHPRRPAGADRPAADACDRRLRRTADTQL
jgi:putative transposase